MREIKRRWPISISLISISVCLMLVFGGYFSRYENNLYDLFQRHFKKESSPSDIVKVILIDDQSINLYSPILGRWPWPRSVYKEIISYINLGEPKGIYFDIIFSEEELDSESQQLFRQSLLESGNVHLGMLFDQDDVFHPLPQDIKANYSIDVKGSDSLNLKKNSKYLLPVRDLLDGSKTLPVFSVDSDEDGIYRSADVIYKYGNNIYPSIALSALMGLTKDNNPQVINGKMNVGGFEFPIDSFGKVYLNYYKNGFEPYSVGAIFNSISSYYDTKPQDALVKPEEFKDKIVIIGVSAVALHDIKSISIGKNVPGTEIHATFLSNVINGEVICKKSKLFELVYIFLITLVCAVSIVFIDSAVAVSIPVLFLGIFDLYAILNYRENLIYYPLIGLNFSIVFSSFLLIFYRIVNITLEKQRIKRTFSKYLSPKVIDEMLMKYEDIKPEIGRKIDTTILFSDIRSFTTISENYPVEMVVGLLNEYFDEMIREIHKNEGTLDKMIGDAIMAFWNAPITVENHQLKAVQTAFKMQDMVVDLNAKWKSQGYPYLAIGIGINSGESIIGNIGSTVRVDYTAIGDTVNLAARLEGLCKRYGARIVISQYTYGKVKNDFSCKLLDKVAVKGKSQPICIYEPYKMSHKLAVEQWNEMMEYYLNKNFKKARTRLNKYIEEYGVSPCTSLYVNRIEEFIDNPPSDDWDGVDILTTK